MRIDWDPVPHLGGIPINWYGLGWVAAFLTGSYLVRRWAVKSGFSTTHIENLLIGVLLGAYAGARLYYVAQNDPWYYITHPWQVFAVWEGGLAFFGGLFGAIAVAYVYCRRNGLPFWAVADLFAPAIPIAAAVGRLPCGLDGVDYGTPTTLPWGVIYTNANSYLVLFSVLRFFLFFVRGNVPVVAFGLKNAQWTALGILAVALPALLSSLTRRRIRLPG